MSLSQALATAVSGLRATQAGLVARRRQRGECRDAGLRPQDAGPGHDRGRRSRRRRPRRRRSIASSTSTSSGSCGSKARARAMPTCARSSIDRLQSVYGVPGSDSALETVYNNFTTALQALSTSPEFGAGAQRRAVSSAQVLAQQLNGMTTDIQGLRSDAELGPRRRGGQGQRRDGADRRDQPAARHRHPQRRHHRDAARPARPVHRPARAADGHQRRRRTTTTRSRSSPDSGIQLVGTRGLDAVLRCARLDDRHRAVERRPDQADGRHHHAQGRRTAATSI